MNRCICSCAAKVLIIGELYFMCLVKLVGGTFGFVVLAINFLGATTAFTTGLLVCEVLFSCLLPGNVLLMAMIRLHYFYVLWKRKGLPTKIVGRPRLVSL